MAKNDTLKTASVLAFERKLDPSDALFTSGNWTDRDQQAQWPAVAVREKSVRGTISNRLKTKDQDPAKLDAEIENPNLQTVDVAALPHDSDTLAVRFTLRVLAGAGHPSACNNADYQQKLKETVSGYAQEHGFGELAHRYACNLANGRFLWRNRLKAENIQVIVSERKGGETRKQWTFDAFDHSLRDFDGNAETRELGERIAAALAGDDHLLLDILAFAHIGAGQEVFPSQELILDQTARKTDEGKSVNKSKTLYSVEWSDTQAAAIHTQKLGNAIRTIDTWYPALQNDADLGPIAVEPYGSVTTQGAAYRQPKQKVDFYNLLDGWLLKDKTPSVDNQHFVMATLIRGGVFGKAD